MAHCLYEKARLYDLCEAGLNFLKCHGSIYAEMFIACNGADRQVMLRGKRQLAIDSAGRLLGGTDFICQAHQPRFTAGGWDGG